VYVGNEKLGQRRVVCHQCKARNPETNEP